MNRDNIITLIVIIAIFMIGIIYSAYADLSEDCKWFWDYPNTGYYLVSEINNEYQLRIDLYSLRSACELR